MAKWRRSQVNQAVEKEEQWCMKYNQMREHSKQVRVQQAFYLAFTSTRDMLREHTRDILLQYIELLQDGPDQALRVLVHDEDLPSPRRVHRPDRLQELCRS